MLISHHQQYDGLGITDGVMDTHINNKETYSLLASLMHGFVTCTHS